MVANSGNIFKWRPNALAECMDPYLILDLYLHTEEYAQERQ